MHQKHPPAKSAVLVGDGAGSAARLVVAAPNTASVRIKVENCLVIGFMRLRLAGLFGSRQDG